MLKEVWIIGSSRSIGNLDFGLKEYCWRLWFFGIKRIIGSFLVKNQLQIGLFCKFFHVDKIKYGGFYISYHLFVAKIL